MGDKFTKILDTDLFLACVDEMTRCYGMIEYNRKLFRHLKHFDHPTKEVSIYSNISLREPGLFEERSAAGKYIQKFIKQYGENKLSIVEHSLELLEAWYRNNKERQQAFNDEYDEGEIMEYIAHSQLDEELLLTYIKCKEVPRKRHCNNEISLHINKTNKSLRRVIKIPNYHNWVLEEAIPQYIEKKLNISSLEGAHQLMNNRNLKKLGRPCENSQLNPIIYGTYLLLCGEDESKVKVPKGICQIINWYVSHIGIVDNDSNVAIDDMNVMARIKYIIAGNLQGKMRFEPQPYHGNTLLPYHDFLMS